ncbi:phycobiliprotein lyase [Allocoleopsis franciscana]|uniref:Chromophore lyase CpcS/CpeS n=1 Tax=Allocoleopsis franciscana PCC 7113 TaxID=1173027 RepID=K9WGN1_9CYAN|nr:phycobiliprotein lyase [Allocoleopsis franciscana]AFZ18662.1 D-alanine transfer protein, teichoic and lipoteichoic acid D-alanine esterification [Allocoleopsis franciscana PCC 7113]
MLDFQEFFTACTGLWKTERIYHSLIEGQVERSFTEFRVESLTGDQKQQILSLSSLEGMQFDLAQVESGEIVCPGFAIAFDTLSETGEQVSMSLKALFIPDTYFDGVPEETSAAVPPLPLTAQVPATPEVIKGYYLRDEGYSEPGAVKSRFTYLPSRQTLEMTTYYRRSVAIDQMRLVAPDLRLRTIITYKRPETGEAPTVIDLVGFGVERRQDL